MVLSSIKLKVKQMISCSSAVLEIKSGLKLNKLSSGKLKIQDSRFTFRGILVPQTELQVSKFTGKLPISTEMQRSLSRLDIEIGQAYEVEVEEYRELYLHNAFISENIENLFEIYLRISYDVSEFQFDLFLKDIDSKKVDSFEKLYEMF